MSTIAQARFSPANGWRVGLIALPVEKGKQYSSSHRLSRRLDPRPAWLPRGGSKKSGLLYSKKSPSS